MARQSGFRIMKRLIVELKPLTMFMLLTIVLGVLGFMSAISIAAFAAAAIADKINQGIGIAFSTAIVIMIVSAALRGPLRYAEQLCGHYIAFKILVILRDKVFAALRKLAPAKLDFKEKGNLVSLVTSDIELLEVFYAHTVAPVSIAIITNTIISIVLFNINPYIGIISAVFFFIVGFCIPYFTSRLGKTAGAEYRAEMGRANSYFLDSLRGLKEILIFNNGRTRAENINKASMRLNEKQSGIKLHEGIVRAVTDLTIMTAILLVFITGSQQAMSGIVSFGEMIISVVILASSFGPVVALSNLSNNLLQTLASAQRLFDLLDEVPEVNEVPGELTLGSLDIAYDNVSFRYKDREEILKYVDIKISHGEKIALIGESGTGKSTFVKLLMRFWNCTEGSITLGGVSIREMPTKTLRANQVLMGQETHIFNETIEDNIRIGNIHASREEVLEAAKKASIHDFIMTLPKNYETKAGELGSNFSSGERQRIGLARAFLSKADILILDEPTSNLDTLNEGQILRALDKNGEGKTIILITHRKSTASICKKTYRLENKSLASL